MQHADMTGLPVLARAAGTFIFAVCENTPTDCRDVDSGSGANPMSVYTFTPTLVKAGRRS